jgi:hypothetical protein
VRKSILLFGACALTVAAVFVATTLHAQNGNPINKGSANAMTLAAFGDWPYSQNLKNSAPLLIESVNSDPKVSLVLHVGDIHSGSMPCTGAFLTPTPATSVPTWNQDIFNLFEQFKDPLVYTPGDNEWTDCHKTGQFTSGAPLNELRAVRNLFFGNPGVTLGGRKKQVITQQAAFDHQFGADAQFVENVMWEESQVLFVTLNVPGSNNDHLPWSGGTATVPGPPYPAKAFLDEPARQREALEREAANLRWLTKAFQTAEANDAKAVLIGLQADMWDPAQLLPGAGGLDGYDQFVQRLAALAAHFGKPVLLINGDSHLYGADQPLSSAFYTQSGGVGDLHHVGFPVPNFTRITVQGSTNLPHEWLRISIDPRSPWVFSWEHVVYCAADPCAVKP